MCFDLELQYAPEVHLVEFCFGMNPGLMSAGEIHLCKSIGLEKWDIICNCVVLGINL